jgi:serine/threonine protein kinase
MFARGNWTMPRKSEALRLLEMLDPADVRRFAVHFGVPHSGAGGALRRRLIAKNGTSLDGLVCLAGPWSRENWNAFITRAGGRPQAHIEDVRSEIRRLLDADLTCDLDLTDEPSDGSSVVPPPPSPFRLPEIGEAIQNRYLLKERLGVGGFGTVFAAHDNLVDSRVVLKFANDAEHAASVLNEYRKASGLSHPNICRYRNFERSEEHGPFVVMQDGGDSIATLTANGPLPRERALSVLRQAALALDFAHAKGVIHGDVSPGNILVDAHDVVTITDFGISAFITSRVRSDGGKTQCATHVHGTHPLFGAPEVLHAATLKPQSDQYSLALVCCAMHTGMKSFQGVLSVDCIPACQRPAITRALSPLHHQRYPTCTDLVRALAGERD